MRCRLAATVALVILAFSVTVSADITPQATTCNGQPYVRLYEAGNYNVTGGNLTLTLCAGTSDASLVNTTYPNAPQNGGCFNQLPVYFGSWNDCVSGHAAGNSFSGQKFCIYPDINYGGVPLYIVDSSADDVPEYPFPSKNDKASSVKYVSSGSCP